MKQRDYQSNPRSYAEPRDRHFAGDIENPNPEQQAKQSEKESCDINEIMKRFEATGLDPFETRRGAMQYGDFSTMETYQEAMGIVADAKALFDALPARVREQFGNDPAKLLEAVELAEKDPKMSQHLVDLGLAEVVLPPAKDPNLAALEAIAANTKPQNKAEKAD